MHDHAHEPGARVDRAFAFGVLLNSVYVCAEFGYGVFADSVALLADAAHNLGDVLGLLLAWGASKLAQRVPSGRRTYGFRKSTVLAALANALLLIGATGALVWEAIVRLGTQPEPAAGLMMIVAGVGVIINTLSAIVLLRSGHAHGPADEHPHGHDINLRGAFLHMAADAAVSLGVVVTGGLMLITHWAWLDPVASLLIAVVIFTSTWSLLREALDLALDAAPRHIDLDGLRHYLRERPGVLEVHDLHVWALGSRDVALTAHLVVEQPDVQLLPETERVLSERFGIAHSTLQLEAANGRPCLRC